MRFPKPSREQRLALRREARSCRLLDTAAIRSDCMTREHMVCALRALGPTYSCSTPASMGLQMDHFWGRGKVAQAVENCWMLCPLHHALKTRNHPSRNWWLDAFRVHATLHGYERQVRLVGRALRRGGPDDT